MLSFFGLLLLVSVLVNVTAVQNFLVNRVTTTLSNRLHTHVSIRHVDFSLFDKFTLEGAFVADQKNDTLLYADKMVVNVTNFFFFKNKTYLRYIGLSDAKVNLQRLPGDSLWNYQFILDALTSPNSSGKSEPPNIDLRRINLQDIHINKIDGWRGQDMHISADKIELDARNIDLRKRVVSVNSIKLDHPLFVLVNYASTKPPDTASIAASEPAVKDTTASLQWNQDNWKLQVKDLAINQGGFALMDKDHPAITNYFDPQHIAFFAIDAAMSNIRIVKDSIITDLKLSAKERSGLLVKQLDCRFKISPVEMEFSHLNLETNSSHISNYFSMSFADFSELNDFVRNVFLRADFVNAEVSSDDIAFFAPPLSAWKKNIEINGQAYGTISNLTGNNLDVKAGSSTTLQGHLKMRGLPNIDNTFIDFEAEQLTTTGQDIQQFVPALKNQSSIDFNSLSRLNFTGSYTGFIEDFVAYGDFDTNLGKLHSDINLKFGKRHIVPMYSGNVSADNFNLGKLLGDSLLGPSSFSAKIVGSGFSFDELNAKVDAEIDQVYFKGYGYQNITANGTLDKKLFNGLFQVADPNLNMNFAGSIDFNTQLPEFKFQADIAKSDLRVLNLTKDSITFRGKLDLNISGNNLDNFLGDARLYDINLYKNNIRLAFDTLAIHSALDSLHGKRLTVQGNEISGVLQGNYDLDALPSAVQYFLHQYYPNKFSPTKKKDFTEDFHFDFKLGNAGKIISTFIPMLSGLDYTTLSGSMNTKADSLQLMVSVPELNYDHYQFNDIVLNAAGKNNGLGLITNIGEIFDRDSLLLPSGTIKLSSSGDTSYVNIQTAASETLNNADIYARIVTLQDGYILKVLNSELEVNNKIWRITPDNEITLQKDNIKVHHFNISHNNQTISVTSDSSKSSIPAFLVTLKDIYVGDFTQIFMVSPKMEGIANGTIRVEDPLGNMVATAELKASQFRINNDSLGIVQTKVVYNQHASSLKWNVFKDDNPSENFSMQGIAGLSQQNKSLSGDFVLNHTNISMLNSFIGDYVSDFDGYATGQVKLGGTTSAPEIIGAVRLDSVRMKVNYLGTFYTLNNETVRFNPSSIDLGTMTLIDVTGNKAVLSGKITHHNLNDLKFNVDLNTQHFRMLNTTVFENPLYYGKAEVSGRVSLTGPLNDMRMTVNVSPLKNTHIYLPLSDAADIGRHDFVIFKQYGTEMKPVRPENSKVNLTVKLYANMNPNATIDVIVDASSGDRISASGNGALQMDIDLKGGFKMYGNYTITKGNYTFSFKGLLSRDFAIDEGSTISWNGNPASANVNISAIYSVPGGANLSDLVAGEDEYSDETMSSDDYKIMKRREKVDVYLTLKGSLSHPDISYDIRLPDASISAASYAMTKLQQIRQNPNDLINQVAALLAFGQFIPESTGTANNSMLVSGGLSSAGQWVSSQLSGVLNNLFGNTLRKWGMDFNLNYNAYSTTGEYGALQRNDVQFNLSKNIFNNRVRIEAGPSIDWGRGNTASAANNSYFAGDFQFEYMITPDGHVRFIAFSRSNYDVLLDRNLTRGGIGISYNRSFNRLQEFFMSRQQRTRRDSLRGARLNRYLQQTADSLPDFDSLRLSEPQNDTAKPYLPADSTMRIDSMQTRKPITQ